MPMETRTLGPFTVSALGLGCMSMSHAYGRPDDEESVKTLHRALDLGYTMLDTAALYGFGKNESLIGKTLKGRRAEYTLASKCGIFKNADGRREINGRPEVLKRTCEESLQRLHTDVIDLYYLHRYDRKVPIKESVGALGDLMRAGKIRAIGLSEVSAATLKQAHAEHPVAAVQTEYSLWTRNAEIEVLKTCKDLGVGFVAFSPLARGFLTGCLTDTSALEESDLRLTLPRFRQEHFGKNLRLLDEYAGIAAEAGCTMAQLALAWLLTRGDHIVPIPGSRRQTSVEENAGAVEVKLDPAIIERLDRLINQHTVSGPRYNETTQKEIDTEEFS